jgi:hypothetical protein
MTFHSEASSVFIEGKDYHLDLYRKEQGGWWHMSESTTLMGAFRTIKYLRDEDPVLIAAIYKKRVIGQGEYYKRGPAGRLERIETIKSEDGMVGVIERAFEDYKEDMLSLEELAQERECDWPGCRRMVNSGAIARVLRIQLDDQSTQKCVFYGCNHHAEALGQAQSVSVSLMVGTSQHPRRSKTRTLLFR